MLLLKVLLRGALGLHLSQVIEGRGGRGGGGGGRGALALITETPATTAAVAVPDSR